MITNNGAICDICKKTIDPLTDHLNIFKLPLQRKVSHCCNDCKEKAKQMMKKGEQ